MNRKVKIIGLVCVIIVLYYGLQYAASAIHHNCAILKDDCVPPINLAGELIYRVIVQPSWLDQFENDLTMFIFKDGRFSFWEGEVNGNIVVLRVREDESPVMLWIEKELPLGIPIRPASGERIQQWIDSNPEYKLSE
jgi:hypothetical protein